MKKYFNYFMIIAALLSLYSCSDDESTSSVSVLDKAIFNITNVNTVHYEESRIDTLGALFDTQIGVSHKLADSIVADFASMVYSRTIAEVKGQPQLYRTNPTNSEFFIYSDCINDLVYKLSPYGNTLKFPFELPQMWVKIGDKANNTWSIYSQQLTNFLITQGQYTNGTLSINGKKGGSLAVTVKDSVINTQEFIVSFNYTGTLVGSTATFDLNFDIKYYFAENIGIVKTVIPYTLFNLGLNFPIEGYNYIATTIN